MGLRTRSRRRATDRIEDVAAWILVAAGLLVVLVSCGVGVRVHDEFFERDPGAGHIPVPAALPIDGLRAGTTVAVGTGAPDAASSSATTPQQALLSGLVAGGMLLIVGIAALVGLWALVRRATMTVNCARWEEEWREVGPIWTRDIGK